MPCLALFLVLLLVLLLALFLVLVLFLVLLLARRRGHHSRQRWCKHAALAPSPPHRERPRTQRDAGRPRTLPAEAADGGLQSVCAVGNAERARMCLVEAQG